MRYETARELVGAALDQVREKRDQEELEINEIFGVLKKLKNVLNPNRKSGLPKPKKSGPKKPDASDYDWETKEPIHPHERYRRHVNAAIHYNNRRNRAVRQGILPKDSYSTSHGYHNPWKEGR